MERTWSTEVAPAHARFDYWREAVCQAFLDLEPEPLVRRREVFAGDIRAWQLGALDVADIRAGPQRVRRTPRGIERSPRPGWYVNVQLRGRSVTSQEGREAALGPGDAVVVDALRPFEMRFEGSFRQLAVWVPGVLLSGQRPLLAGRRLGGASPTGAAAVAALTAACRHGLAPALVPHVVGLVASGVDTEGRPPSSRPANRVTRDDVLTDIDRHLCDPSLSPGMCARRLGVSVRTVHARCAEAGVSFARRVTARRLDRARELLEDARYDHVTMTGIAIDVGFVNPSHFARVFRASYGAPPSQWRVRRP